MKAQHIIIQSDTLIGRRNSAISRIADSRGYRPNQASELPTEHSEQSSNLYSVAPWVKEQANAFLGLQFSLEQLASCLIVSHETPYKHVYADETQGGTLWKSLRNQKQKSKIFCSGRDLRGQIPNRRPLSQCPEHIEGRKQVGHWECDTVLGGDHKQAIVTVVKRKIRCTVMTKISNKTADLISQAIINALTPFEAMVKTLSYYSDKEFCGHSLSHAGLNITDYFARPFASWGRGCNENFNGFLCQYVHKKRPIKNINDKEIKMTKHRLNNRAHKRLGFRTFTNVFSQSLSV